jgi:hypothetical protein
VGGHVKKTTQQIQKVLMLHNIFPLGWFRTLGTMRCTGEKDNNCNKYSQLKKNNLHHIIRMLKSSVIEHIKELDKCNLT